MFLGFVDLSDDDRREAGGTRTRTNLVNNGIESRAEARTLTVDVAQSPSGSEPRRTKSVATVIVTAETVSSAFVNDPSAGSPTETLLRLLLPLDDQVRFSFRATGAEAETPAEGTIRRPH